MIIVRAPLRITLGGGGTDIPAYYQKHGGFCVSAAIDKYVYVTVHRTFEAGITLKYSKVEHVQSVDEIQHPIFREVLKMANITDPHLEISSHADIPAGTGLGSSSSFTVALLKAIYTYLGLNHCDPGSLASNACEIEITRLGEPIGKQDQTAAAYGGLAYLTFCPDGIVEVELKKSDWIQQLEWRLMMFYTGHTRSASETLRSAVVDNMSEVARSGYLTAEAIDDCNINAITKQLNVQWTLKLERHPDLDPQIIKWRDLGLANGANAGKLVGAGSGGFLLFLVHSTQLLRSAMFNAGLPEVRFKFDWEGCKVIAQ